MLTTMRRLPMALTALALLASVACQSGSPGTSDPGSLPEGDQLLSAAAGVMSGLSSVSFDIDIEADGEPSNFQIQQALGTVTADGDVTATARLYLGERLVEAEYIRVDGTSYLMLVTGGFRELAESTASRIFDPSALLDEERGIPAALASASEATTQALEEVEGVDSYRVSARLDPDLIEGLSQLASGREQPFTLWVSADDNRLIRAQVTFEEPDGGNQTDLSVTFSGFNEDVDIQAPL